MNVNNILNLLQDCSEGMCRKETTMAVEGSLKGGINFHREENTIFGLHWPREPKAARWP